MAQDDCYIGIDAGGSKTIIRLQVEGKRYTDVSLGPANPESVPLSEILTHIINALQSLRESESCDPQHMQTVCIGMAGLNTPEQFSQVVKSINALTTKDRQLFGKKIILVNDAFIGLYEASKTGWGIGIIAGTGANCYGLIPDGQSWSAGNWGYIAGNQHSGFVMGQNIVQQIMMEFDGRASLSPITQIVLNELNITSAPDLINWIYQQNNPITATASLTRLLQNHELSTQLPVQSIIKSSINSLLLSYQAVVNKLKFDKLTSFPVVLAGGLFYLESNFTNPVKTAILQATPNASVIVTHNPPVAGALKIARTQGRNIILPKMSKIVDLF